MRLCAGPSGWSVWEQCAGVRAGGGDANVRAPSRWVPGEWAGRAGFFLLLYQYTNVGSCSCSNCKSDYMIKL